MDQATAEARGEEQTPPTHPSQDTETEAAQPEGLAPNLQAHIGRHLRAVFDEVAREPVPDRFLQLLKDLERGGDK
jgi:hypothetical protein